MSPWGRPCIWSRCQFEAVRESVLVSEKNKGTAMLKDLAFNAGVRPGLRIQRALFSALLVFAVAPSVLAQQVDQGTLQEVVVTATKREQTLQEVPLAVSAVTGDTLQAMGAESFTDYARTVPGLTFTDLGAGRQKPALRGMNVTTGSDVVSYYIGEIPLPTTAGTLALTVANPALIDVDRVEVLRGPQGTLYGSGSMGGTIKLVPNGPDLSKTLGFVQANATATQGEGGTAPGGELDMGLNVPLIPDVAALRTVAWGRDNDGFINREYGYTGSFPAGSAIPTGVAKNIPDEHTWGFRTEGLLKLSDQLSILGLVYLQDQKFNGFQDITGGASNPDDALVQDLISNVSEPSENKFQLYALTVTYDFSTLRLVSATGLYRAYQDAVEEGTSTLQSFVGAPAFPNALTETNSLRDYTEEFRLATTKPIAGLFDGVVGLFYSDKRTERAVSYSPSNYNSIAADNDPQNPLYVPGNDMFTDNEGGTERQVAEFGELTYHLFRGLDLTFGIRHFRISSDNDGLYSGLFAGTFTPKVIAQQASSEGTVYKGNLSYQLSPDALAYAQFTQGFRPGFGQTPPPDNCNAGANAGDVQPDSVDNYEIGVKTGWLNKRLTVNASVYRIDWRNIQQLEALPCGFDIYGNAGKAINRGVELEAEGRISSYLNAGLSGSYTSAKLQNSATAFAAMAGDQIENVPSWQYAVYAETAFPVGQGFEGFGRVDYQYTGSSFGNYNRLDDGMRDPLSKLGALRLLNLRTGIRRGNWEIALTGSNLLNQIARESIETSLLADIPGRPRYVVNRPRTFGISGRYAF
jgi:iron complex outermembrane receptor protein